MTEKANILLVDDRPENLLALEAVLEPLEYNLITATSGQEALKHLLDEDFSVILLDVQMPDMDGLETAKHIKEREHTRDVPIIFLTAISKEPQHAVRGYSEGAVDYIPKPFDPNALRAKVAVFVELHEKNELLKQQAKELERSNDELQQFAYIASHDLREPLRVMSGYLDLLREDFGEILTEDGLNYIKSAMKSGDRMSALIDDLLKYSRVGAQARELERTELEVLVKQATENLGKVIEETKAEITTDELPTVVADPSLIVQLLQNLISNAIKFRGDNPPIVHVGAQREGDRWVISVTDNGIGFAPKDEKRVFEIFQRLHSASEYPGTGIGLAICKKIAEQHGGRIWAESATGTGTAFHFTLQAAEKEKK